MADENTEDLSMEDILSSIRDILTEDVPIQKDQASADVPSATPEIVSEPVYAPRQTEEVPPAEPVIGAAVEDELSVAASEDDVFDLSPAMIVNNDPLAQDLDYPAETPNEVTEDDILDLSRLVTAQQPEVAELSASLEEPVPAGGDEMEVAAPFSASEGIDLSAVLGNQESFNVDDISLDLDNVPDSEPAFPTTEPAAAPQPQDFAAAIPSLDFDLPKVDVDADPIFAPEDKSVSELSSQQLMESIPASADESVAEEEENIIDDAALDEILNLHSQAEDTHPEEMPLSVPQIQEEAVAAEFGAAEIQAPVEEVPAEMSEPAPDATDVSANIINNFAKLFAEKKAAEAAQTPAADYRLPLKTDSVSVGELVRDAVVKQVTEQMTASFETFAREAVAAQTQAWLDANLPAIVEAVVSKEIERVMAKVGS